MALSDRTKNTIALLFGLTLAVTAFEIIGRLTPLNKGFRTNTLYTQFHPVLGFELDPTIGEFVFQQTCLQISPVTIDSHGHRVDRTAEQKLTTNQPVRIAILGDSFMMGREVADSETTAAQLAAAVQNAAVINYGVPGYGTTQAYLSYILKAREYKPIVTVLGFLDVNDVAENSAYLSNDEALLNFRPFLADDGETILPPKGEPSMNSQFMLMPGKIHGFLKQHSLSYYATFTYVAKPLQRVTTQRLASRPTTYAAGGDANRKPYEGNAHTPARKAPDYWWQRKELFRYLAIYQRKPDDKFEAAWRATEKALLLLRDAVSKDQGHFVLMLIPAENASWMENALKEYKQEFGEAAPPGFDLDYPAERLMQFGAKHNIDVLDLGPHFAAYRDKHSLGKPYFAFHCDGHWNPIGHYLAAHTLAEHLAAQGIIDSGRRNRTDFMDYSPEQLLGEHALWTIFGWLKVYRGDSDLGKN